MHLFRRVDSRKRGLMRYESHCFEHPQTPLRAGALSDLCVSPRAARRAHPASRVSGWLSKENARARARRPPARPRMRASHVRGLAHGTLSYITCAHKGHCPLAGAPGDLCVRVALFGGGSVIGLPRRKRTPTHSMRTRPLFEIGHAQSSSEGRTTHQSDALSTLEGSDT